tara:strand:- start:429 stop:581 length:153 start_codon:yes stop_codon:yes gene_type:complete
MTERLFIKQYNKLLSEIAVHPNHDELLNIMSQQLIDDTNRVKRQVFKKKR